MMLADPNTRLCRIKDFRPRLSTRSGPLGWIVVLVVAAISAPTSAAIVPRWRQNPITPAAIDVLPRLADAVSFSLLVDLTGDSLFLRAGLTLDQGDLPGMEVYQAISSLDPHNTRPTPLLILFYPPVEFDTYIDTTDTSAVVHIFSGYSALPHYLGDYRQFDVSWGTPTGTDPPGGFDLEIARVTLFNVRVDPTGTPVRGEVRATDLPSVAVPLPNLPVRIPEPGLSFTAGLLAMLALRTRRAC